MKIPADQVCSDRKSPSAAEAHEPWNLPVLGRVVIAMLPVPSGIDLDTGRIMPAAFYIGAMCNLHVKLLFVQSQPVTKNMICFRRFATVFFNFFYPTLQLVQ